MLAVAKEVDIQEKNNQIFITKLFQHEKQSRRLNNIHVAASFYFDAYHAAGFKGIELEPLFGLEAFCDCPTFSFQNNFPIGFSPRISFMDNAFNSPECGPLMQIGLNLFW